MADILITFITCFTIGLFLCGAVYFFILLRKHRAPDTYFGFIATLLLIGVWYFVFGNKFINPPIKKALTAGVQINLGTEFNGPVFVMAIGCDPLWRSNKQAGNREMLQVSITKNGYNNAVNAPNCENVRSSLQLGKVTIFRNGIDVTKSFYYSGSSQTENSITAEYIDIHHSEFKDIYQRRIYFHTDYETIDKLRQKQLPLLPYIERKPRGE